MVKDLPTGEMKWSKNLEYERTYDNTLLPLKYEYPGFVYEVDLKYPIHLKEKTQHFPYCPEKTKLTKLYKFYI